MKDVHAMAPTRPHLELRRVGLEHILKPLTVERESGRVTLTASFAVAVDLPADRKGSDLSRNAELLAEIVDQTANRPVPSLESACSDIARELLVRHPYAMESEVRSTAPYFRRRGVSPERASFEDYLLVAEATARRERGDPPVLLRRFVGGEAIGMTACPCAMVTAREALVREYPKLSDPSLADLPIVTHNQRNRTRLVFEVDAGAEVEVDEILDAIEAAQSSPTFAILKRGDEASVVLAAHRRPKFVEDVLRDLLASLPARFPRLPDAARIAAETRSEESIHKYDVVASNELAMGELRTLYGA